MCRTSLGASSGGPRIVTVFDVLEGRVAIEAGQRVVLLDEDGTFKAGGTAEFLADRGADVHVVTGAGTVGRDLHMVSQVPLARRLREKGVNVHPERSIKKVDGNTVELVDVYDEHDEAIDGVDLIVASTGNLPEKELYEALSARGDIKEVVAVGDCIAPRKAMDAIREGHMAARAI